MPYSEPVKAGDPLEVVRRIARLSQLLLELRNEYERRANVDLLIQIKERAAELYALSQELVTPEVKEKEKDE